MISAILAVYGVAFFILGIIFVIALQPKPSEKAMLSRARRKRARKEGRVKTRVHYDYRIKRHRKNGAKYR